MTPVASIARQQKIPAKFLEQILLLLKSAGLVGSKRGPRGGYYLSRRPSEISLADVVDLTEPSMFSGGDGESDTPFGEVWSDIHGYIRNKLEQVTIEDMCNRARELAGAGANEYVI